MATRRRRNQGGIGDKAVSATRRRGKKGDDLLVSSNGEEDRLLCHWSGHSFGGGVDDKLLRDRGGGKHKLLKNI